MTPLFADRRHAGRILAELLREYVRGRDAVVLALPRGGVPVAYEVAHALDLPLDIAIVRKLGLPQHPELAMGAVASGGAVVLNPDVIQQAGITPQQVEAAVKAEEHEVARREKSYRGIAPAVPLTGRSLIVVDDGLATGATMRVAVKALRKLNPRDIAVAVPVAPAQVDRELLREADEFFCVETPERFYAVGQWYAQFDQTTDEEVRELLKLAHAAPPEPAASRRAGG